METNIKENTKSNHKLAKVKLLFPTYLNLGLLSTKVLCVYTSDGVHKCLPGLGITETGSEVTAVTADAVVVTVDVMAVSGHITVDTMGCVTADVTEVTEVVTAGEVTVKYKDG